MRNLLPVFQNAYFALRFISVYGVRGFSIFTHLTWQEQVILYRLVQKLEAPLCLVEIGSYLGGSAYFLAAAASEAVETATLYCVDTWQNDAMSEGKRDTWKKFITNTQRFSTKITPLRGLSHDIGRYFSDEIDLLFIDGDHSYDSCRDDTETWLPKVKKGGVVLFHDYGWAVGVQKVVNDLVANSILVNGNAYQNIFWCNKV